MSEKQYVYYIVDYTNDEMFIPLGVFLNYKQAKMQLLNFPKGRRISIWYDECDESERICIYKNEVGLNGMGTKVFEIRREEVYDEKRDAFVIETVSTWENENENE